ncbi:response regulator transcription factor [Sutterella sp.]|uniref:response regulator n=1 Tax=Sutterella sp. TaxID=1981025 RepID=UPI0026DF9905|nr:response regulator transcription factor [Sutterella sp.]MDO5532110.1 response regulator transcription factor [Sutterella sp.]
MRILLVEDDPMIAEAVNAALADESHVVQHVTNGRSALGQIAANDYQLVLLDLGLPGLDGMTVLRTMRAEKRDTPVIILTARDALEDRLQGLDAGADDYLVKPFHMSELLARMRAVMRRRNGAADNVITNGVITLFEDTKSAEMAGRKITLTKREYSLLAALLARPGAILSRRALEDRIYAAGEEPESNAVEYLIHSLRKKLSADAIRNVRGLGWMVASRDDAAKS